MAKVVILFFLTFLTEPFAISGTRHSWLIRFVDGSDQKMLLEKWQKTSPSLMKLTPLTWRDTYLFESNSKDFAETMVRSIRKQGGFAALNQGFTFRPIHVEASVKNHKNSKLGDPLFKNQWEYDSSNLGHLFIKNVWKKKRPKSNPIIAVFDSEVDLNHEDLVGTFDKNSSEILNGLDDDKNGFIDDVFVKRFEAQNSETRHGTHVVGILSAIQNNHIGITGMSGAKLLLFSAKTWWMSTLIQAYQEVIRLKKLWIDSKGKQGRNIIAINLSMGIGSYFCQELNFMTWNDLMNSAGRVGILSVTAASNDPVDVDKVGDVPSTCSSEFQIAVSGSDQSGGLANHSWGKASVDLIAPSVDILSLIPNQSYGISSGTSMAAPHVSAALWLLKSLNKVSTADFTDPEHQALKLKQQLITVSTKVPSLIAKTLFSKRLSFEGKN